MTDIYGLQYAEMTAPKRIGKVHWEEKEQTRMLAGLLRPVIGTTRARQVATKAMTRFGSLPATLAAPSFLLREVDGIGERAASQLALAHQVATCLARQRIDLTKPILSSWTELMDYCNVAMAHEGVEQVRVLFLDAKHRLIADEVLQTGTIDQTPVYPREVIRRTLELSASGLILLHNHPSGDPTPSAADVRKTREIRDAGRPMGIVLHDHVVIGRQGYCSLKTLKLL